MKRDNITLAGVLAGVFFAAGLVGVLMIPGLGGTAKTHDFTSFYDSSSKRGAASLLFFALTIGAWLMTWLCTEIRARLGESVRPALALRLATIGATAVMVGAAVDAGPTMVQNNSDNGTFVGIPIAHAFAQAGAGAVIAGLFTFAAAVLLFGLEFRHSEEFATWLGTLSIVIAVLLVGSAFLAPGFLLPLWAIIVGIGARRGARTDAGRAATRSAAPPSERRYEPIS